ncbi:MAG TPA: response regulator, partial [Pyrinomonadaceae bacterium]
SGASAGSNAGRQGCNLVGLAAEGEEAISMIRLLRPDVILLDVSMPLKDGVQVLREVRQEDSEVIIIMFTGDTTPELKKVCLEAGANYFVNKSQFRMLRDSHTASPAKMC